ncbi:sigma-70 family RNA polymerase sigma factor [Granulicella sp. WH15]|uniref:RNA polymerase sigma factor n=1 Tax=Granulicella sp. WH15 TaxID=2602070 RepID=UPI0013678865|nr:sigma-70 family RNA polymerase sigma factor [Granulicella sp. WH15]QHN02007.1 sigma-70 family RNA polymerase sigma factor [Granulicella sp. WH15]
MTLTEESSLAVPATAKDEVDLAGLVETYSGLLFRVAHAVLRNPSEAEDVVQDTFVRVLQHRSKLAKVLDVRVWLVRIAWNLALDRRRRVRPDQMDEAFAAALVAQSLLQDEVFAEATQLKRVLAVIEGLPGKERKALLLAAIEELGTAELAAVLGKSESAVRSLLFRARARLKERLAKGGFA